MEKCIIAAVADNGAIGRGNALLWHIPADMKYFRELTTGSTVIMGRRTFESIGKPLPKRRNIVVSRSGIAIDGVTVAHSVWEALVLAGSRRPVPALSGEPGLSSLSGSPDTCFIIGGGEIYRQAMAFADRLYITEVHLVADDADTFFPEISPDLWKEETRSRRMTDESSGVEFEFVEYRRRA